MPSASREAKLNSLLTQAKQLYTCVQQSIPTFNAEDANGLTGGLKPLIKTCAGHLLLRLDEIDQILREFTFEGAPKDVSRSAYEMYRDEIRPKREEILQIAAILFDVPLDPEVDLRQTRDSHIWLMLTQGVDTAFEEDGNFTAEEIRRAEALTASSFFRPDEWVRNADDIQPAAFGPNADQRIPGHVRVRLREILHSFILNNHLAAIALARAVLEYSLNDRATKIGIDTQYPTRSDRKKSLRWLVEEASEYRPHLKQPMDTIVDAANRTLHQRKDEKLFLMSHYLRTAALHSTRAIRVIIEDLYF